MDTSGIGTIRVRGLRGRLPTHQCGVTTQIEVPQRERRGAGRANYSDEQAGLSAWLAFGAVVDLAQRVQLPITRRAGQRRGFLIPPARCAETLARRSGPHTPSRLRYFSYRT